MIRYLFTTLIKTMGVVAMLAGAAPMSEAAKPEWVHHKRLGVMLSASVRPAAGRLATGHITGAIALWNLGDDRPLRELHVRGEAHSLALAPDASLLAAGLRWETRVPVIRAESAKVLGEISGPDGIVRDVDFSPDGALLAIGGAARAQGRREGATGHASGDAVPPMEDGMVRLWRTADLSPAGRLRDLRGGKGELWRTRFSPAGELVAGLYPDDSVVLWRVRDGEVVQRVPIPTGGRTEALALSPDGKILALGSGSSLWLVELALSRAARPLGRPVQGSVTSLHFSADGHVLFGTAFDEAFARRVSDGGSVFSAPFPDPENNNPLDMALLPTGDKAVVVGGGKHIQRVFQLDVAAKAK